MATFSIDDNIVSRLSKLKGNVKATIAKQIAARDSEHCHHSYLGKIADPRSSLVFHLTNLCSEFTCGHSCRHPELPYPSHTAQCGGNLMKCTPLRLLHLPVPVGSDCAECILESRKQISEEKTLSYLLGLLPMAEATNLRNKATVEGLSVENFLAMCRDGTSEDQVRASPREASEPSQTSSGYSGQSEVANRKSLESNKQEDTKNIGFGTMGHLEEDTVLVDVLPLSTLEAIKADVEISLETSEEPFVLLDPDEGAIL